jgi:hypothetical protein
VNEFFSIHLVLPVALARGVYSASNRNEHQKQENNVSGYVERCRRVGLTTLPQSVSRLSRQQPKRPPRPATGMASCELSDHDYVHLQGRLFTHRVAAFDELQRVTSRCNSYLKRADGTVHRSD